MAELVDALDLESSGETRAGSIPVSCTITNKSRLTADFLFTGIFGYLSYFICNYPHFYLISGCRDSNSSVV